MGGKKRIEWGKKDRISSSPWLVAIESFTPCIAHVFNVIIFLKKTSHIRTRKKKTSRSSSPRLAAKQSFTYIFHVFSTCDFHKKKSTPETRKRELKIVELLIGSKRGLHTMNLIYFPKKLFQKINLHVQKRTRVTWRSSSSHWAAKANFTPWISRIFHICSSKNNAYPQKEPEYRRAPNYIATKRKQCIYTTRRKCISTKRNWILSSHLNIVELSMNSNRELNAMYFTHFVPK